MNLDPAAAGHPDAPRYAGFWFRVFANVLDVLMLAAINAGFALAFSVPDTRQGPDLQVGSVIAPLVVVFFWIGFGATPGKMLLGLRIVDSRTGLRPSAWQCVGRYVMAFLSMAFAGVGYLWIAIDARHQAWHDKIVGTLVIRTRG